ncbi:MAG: carboxymuconolactone decarboxylase family protein [Planctomycetota bacterium]|nr:carboxymuconolactone decarboxylase family protein [Planctomycetota bacterium]
MTHEKVTAGRDELGGFAPQFARINDDLLFGEVWADEATVSPRERSMITVAALTAGGIAGSPLEFHLGKARDNGVTRGEIASILTHLSFYGGWPRAWAAFRAAKEIWSEERPADNELGKGAIFGVGEPNVAYAKYFTGQSYLKMLTTQGVATAHVTFAPGCRNWWHIHRKGGQILLATGGRGYCREYGEEARELRPGDVVSIKADVKHWHGAAADSWFSHLALEIPAEGASNEWVEPVTDEEYGRLK